MSQLGLLERVGEDSEMHFLPAIGGGQEGDEKAEPQAAEAPAESAPKRTLADLLEGYIGAIRSSEHIPGGANMSVDTGKRFAEGLWEQHQRDQEEARQRYAKERGQHQRE